MSPRTLCLYFILSSLVCVSVAQENIEKRWQKLIGAGKCDEARPLCKEWVGSKDALKEVEGHKCLANVMLCGAEVVVLQGADNGGGTIGSGYRPEAVNDALGHLEQALKLAPQDLSIHKGRLHLLEVSSRYDDMAKALDESCSIYKGAGAETWLDYTAELFHARQFRAGLALLEVLDKHYPNSHDVLGNMGAMHGMLKEDAEAIPYLLKATELAPSDPIDAWNLAKEYEFVGKPELADGWYQKALALEPDSEAKKERACFYAQFVEKQLRDNDRACKLETLNCAPDKQSACVSSKQ